MLSLNLMPSANADTIFALENFEGPLDFLLHLVQKSEIPISEIQIFRLVQQYIDRLPNSVSLNIDDGAHFVQTTASLIWLKSKTLLPVRDSSEALGDEERDPFSIFPQLLEYARIREAAASLEHFEKNQRSYYSRGCDPEFAPSKSLQGIESVDLKKLHDTFYEALKKRKETKGTIKGETWRIKDMIQWMRDALKTEGRLKIDRIFSREKCREELIVSFLAILELMKLEELGIIIKETAVYLSRRG